MVLLAQLVLEAMRGMGGFFVLASIFSLKRFQAVEGWKSIGGHFGIVYTLYTRTVLNAKPSHVMSTGIP